MLPLGNTLLLYLSYCMKSHLLKTVLIIVHKSLQISRSKTLSNSQHYSALTLGPVNRLTNSSLLCLGNRPPSEQLRASAWGRKKKFQLSQAVIPNSRLTASAQLLHQGFLPCSHVQKSLLNFMPQLLQPPNYSTAGMNAPACLNSAHLEKAACWSVRELHWFPAQADQLCDKNQRQEKLQYYISFFLKDSWKGISKLTSVTRFKRISSMSACCEKLEV